MLAVLITLTPGRRNQFIDCQTAEVWIAALPGRDVKTQWNSALGLRDEAYWLREFTREWLKYQKYSDYRPLFTTQDEWMIVKYVRQVLRPLRRWTLWMSKWHTVTLHHVVTVYNDTFNHLDGGIQAFAKKKTQWEEDLHLAMKFACQKLTRYYAGVAPTTSLLLISSQILDSFQKLRLFRQWDKGTDNALMRKLLYYPLLGGVSAGYGEWILGQILTFARH